VADPKVIGKIGQLPNLLILIDPDSGDRWLVTVSVDMSNDTPIAKAPSDLISGAHWMMRNGGYVNDVAPQDAAAVETALAAFNATEYTDADYATAEERWPAHTTNETSD
jgi:hypothetical protein